MDHKSLLSLIDHFGKSPVEELELQDGSTRLILRKEKAVCGRPAALQDGATPVAPMTTGGMADQAVRLGLPAKAAEAISGGEEITSPIVGTFYRAPSPDAPSFVEVGDTVKAGQTLCILEAMKMMNHLEAEFDCRILTVRAQNGELVEYGEALFDVERI